MTRLTILLPEEIPYENKGEMAILLGLVECLRPLGEIRLAIVNSNPRDRLYSGEVPEITHKVCDFLPGVRDVGLPVYAAQTLGLIFLGLACRLGLARRRGGDWGSDASVWRHFMEADCLMYGHDNYFAERINHRFLAISLFAKLANRPTIIPAASIGPFKRYGWKAKLLKRLVLDTCDAITLRDEPSCRYLDRLGIGARHVELTTDLAFLMPAADEDQARAWLERNVPSCGQGVVVGMTPTRLVARLMESYDHRILRDDHERFEAYVDMHVKAIDALTRRDDTKILLIAHSVGPEERQDDRAVNSAVRKACSRHARVVCVEEEMSAPFLKAIIGHLDLLVGGRTHSIIAALGQGTPVLATSSPSRHKTNGIVAGLFGISDAIFSVREATSTGFVSAVLAALSCRQTTRARIREKSESVRTLAKRNGEVFAETILGRAMGRSESPRPKV